MLFPHEFLFLMCNSKNRLELIGQLPKPELSTLKMSIRQYNMQDLDSKRLDYLYKIEENFFDKDNRKNPE